jgi:hypothetical protein
MSDLFNDSNKNTTVLDRPESRPRRRAPRAAEILIQQELVREFSASEIDLDHLADAIRKLVEP